MNVHNDLNDLPAFKNAVITIGSFDGVHSGHQKIVQKVKNLAQNIGGESVVITFHPHPREVIFPGDQSLRLLTTIHEKIRYFRELGVDHLVVVPFTVEFSQQKADEYIENFLVGKFHPRYIVIGYDHRFGLNRQGDINFLKWHAQKYGYEVIEIPKQQVDDLAISSTKIREALLDGRISVANKLLGHPFLLTGTVVKGQQIGQTIGYPTANLHIPQKNKLIPADGIYAVYVYYKGERYKGMLYIGTRPTIETLNGRTIEVHIFDFNKTLYGDTLQIEFLEKIRDDARFEDLNALKNQLEKDKSAALKIIRQHEKDQEAQSLGQMPAVAVVILNWNGRALLEQFLPSVLKTDYPNFEVIVADNGSTDDSVAFVEARFPDVRVLVLDENHGFAEGYNRALKLVGADYYVLLNSDVEVTPDWMRPVIAYMENDPTVGAVQPKIKSFHDRHLFEYAGAAGGWLDYLGYPFCRGRIFATVEPDEGQYDSIEEVFWASGAALFVRPALFHGLGGFDGSYFAHLEEIDFCWRLKRAGYKVLAFPQSVVYHVGGSTLNYLSPRKTYLNFRNSYFTLVKNESKRKLAWLLPTRLLLDAVAGGLFLFQGKFRHILSIIKAHWAFFPKFFTLWRSRATYRDLIEKISISPIPNRKGILPKSVIVQYFLSGKKYFRDL
ncbi:MAG: bifunctional riboflavin kinase/FAD synthetase [Bacteroidetes bacterium]|nr:MAG: bifunctional riboflavin kinase/FAD synthetase [Bacteroidota bacterium]